MYFDVVYFAHRSKRSQQGPDGGYQEVDFGLSYPNEFVMEQVRGETAINGVAMNAATGDAGFSTSSAEVGLTWNDTARLAAGRLACNATNQTTGLQLLLLKQTEERKEKALKGCESVRLAPEYF